MGLEVFSKEFCKLGNCLINVPRLVVEIHVCGALDHKELLGLLRDVVGFLAEENGVRKTSHNEQNGAWRHCVEELEGIEGASLSRLCTAILFTAVGYWQRSVM